MAKLTLNDIASLANTLSAKQALNENFAAIEEALEDTLSRSGATPNQMEADIDLDSNDLLNVGQIDAARYYINGVPFSQSVAYSNKQFQLFTGTGALLDFVLEQDPASLGNLEVSVDGVVQRPGVDFTYSGTTLTFVTAPPATGPDNILVRFDEAVPTGVTSAAAVDFQQIGTGTAIRTLQNRGRDIVSAKDFLCADGLPVVGDGVHDDTTGLQRGIDHVATYGGVLELPAGTYKVTAQIGRSVAAARAFTIRGAGWTATQIIRSADYGTVMNFGNVDNFTVEDLTIVGNFSLFPTNANHGIAFFNGSHIRIRRVKVFDWKNTAILGYSFPASTAYINNVIEDCYVDGNNAANNGILIADLGPGSGIRNCSAVDIGKTGSPCYALQMKNGCQHCFIDGGYASGATIGVAIGNYDVTGTHKNNRVHGVHVFNCDTGIGLGTNLGDNISDCIIDMNNGGLSAVDFQLNSKGSVVTGLVVRNHVSTRGVVRFRSGDTNNYVEIAMIENINGLAGVAAEGLAGSSDNTVEVRRYANPTTVSDSAPIFSDAGTRNVFMYTPLPNRQNATIATDAITLRHSQIRAVRLDTEAAAATDDLATINGGVDQQIITLTTTANARDVTVKHGTGNIRLNGGVDVALTATSQTLTVMYQAALSAWVEVARGTAS